MSNQVQVQRIAGEGGVPHTLLDEIKSAAERIKERAFHLFQKRGGDHGQDVGDWLQAERDILGSPESEMEETAAGYHIRVALPGFTAKNVKVTALPAELAVEAEKVDTEEGTEGAGSHAEFRSRIFRRYAFSEPIDVGLVTAGLLQGVLTIEATKAVQPKQLGNAA
jgi:HSP20 family molecular chaperone IbpA